MRVEIEVKLIYEYDEKANLIKFTVCVKSTCKEIVKIPTQMLKLKKKPEELLKEVEKHIEQEFEEAAKLFGEWIEQMIKMAAAEEEMLQKMVM